MNITTTKKATSIRLNRDLYTYIEKLTKKEHRSINNFIEIVLARATHFDTPNKETVEAIEAVERGEVLKFDSVDSWFESIK